MKISLLHVRRAAPTLCLAFVLALGGAAPLTAQPEADLLGQRVRITAGSLGIESWVGRVVDAGPAGVRVEWEGMGASESLGWDEVSKLEVSAGKRSYGARGFLIGTAAGALTGLVLSGAGQGRGPTACGGGGSWFLGGSGCGEGARTGPNAVGITLVGGVVGFILGQVASGETWEDRGGPSQRPAVRTTFEGGSAGLEMRLPPGFR